VRQLASVSRGAHRSHLPGNGWCTGESKARLRLRLAERIKRLSPEQYAKAEGFIEGWKALNSNPRYWGCPHSCLWRTCVVNYSEGAALLGEIVKPRDHRPYTKIRCFAPCVICDQEERGEVERAVQRLLDQVGHSAAAGEGPPGGSVDRAGEGGEPPERGDGKANSQE
jgi:hypothetical protein